MKTILKIFTVCASCYSVGITDNDCICTYSNKYRTIRLEFEVCKCCDNIIDDGNPAETDYNKKIIELENEITNTIGKTDIS